MHKYKYKTYLWKQYINFCITIGSKKHFYKSLTNALRFLPFDVDLWLIGAAYEMEIGHNMWKARKILLKGIKMIPSGTKNLALCLQMFKFEIQFLRTIISRKKIISGEENQTIKFVMP